MPILATDTPSSFKTCAFSRNRCFLALNFGNNAYHSYSDGCEPQIDRKARVTQRRFTGEGLQNDQNIGMYLL